MGDTCRYPSCEKETRDKGDPEEPGSDYTVSAFGSDFCSVEHELKYEKRSHDARQAMLDDQKEQQAVDKKDLPEYDGPPF